jgi:hypothetical protein
MRQSFYKIIAKKKISNKKITGEEVEGMVEVSLSQMKHEGESGNNSSKAY